eukprot:SAG22_NODE_3_length_48349_cov_158.681180_19_plen_56_part_00
MLYHTPTALAMPRTMACSPAAPFEPLSASAAAKAASPPTAADSFQSTVTLSIQYM